MRKNEIYVYIYILIRTGSLIFATFFFTSEIKCQHELGS
jgi:hypothetical protein